MEENRGPFVKKDGVLSDSEIWADELSMVGDKLDEYHLIKAVHEEAKRELARREGEIALEGLMETFYKK